MKQKGQLEVDRNFKIRTLCSRVGSVWTSVAYSRAKFESIPDKGLIGKTVTRFFNRTWNYVFKGCVGSLGILVVYPIVCIGASLGSLLLCVTMPLWYDKKFLWLNFKTKFLILFSMYKVSISVFIAARVFCLHLWLGNETQWGERRVVVCTPMEFNRHSFVYTWMLATSGRFGDGSIHLSGS